MAKKTKVKVKPVKRAVKAEEPETQMPDLVSAMLKLTERLESVERKMDVVLSRIGRVAQPGQPQPQSQHQHQHPQQQAPRPQHPQHSQPSQPFQQNRPNNGGKQMFQAVCAECRKNCEVPFKPTPERATYCKECFTRRKAERRGPQQPNQPNGNRWPETEQRKIKVIPNGVGKVTISEMVPSTKKPARVVKKAKR